ncbi:MAG: replication protein [Armatimonadota bacterium]
MDEFGGFTVPTATAVPDQFFDELMPTLGLAEMRVLLFIIRCTYGSRRISADISLRQMVEGVQDAEGYQLAPGVGLSKATVCRALSTLRRRQVVIAQRRRSEDLGNEPTTYRLNM